MKPRHRRVIAIVAGLVLLGIATALVLNALRGNMTFFLSPTDVSENKAPRDSTFRLGGLVEQGSFKRMPDGLTVNFIVTDTATRIPVSYTGILPDLFKEGKSVIAQGRMGPDGVFQAREVLAKHDENYMPREAADALERAHAKTAKAAAGKEGGTTK